jgi:hypothetical protein
MAVNLKDQFHVSETCKQRNKNLQVLQTFTITDTIFIVHSCYEVRQCNTFLYEIKGVILMEGKQHVTRNVFIIKIY